jgi:hypothetical protein
MAGKAEKKLQAGNAKTLQFFLFGSLIALVRCTGRDLGLSLALNPFSTLSQPSICVLNRRWRFWLATSPTR